MNTKRRLIYAMKNLLEKHEIEQITIEMILNESDLSKSTFYRYFSDKYMLMTEYYNYNVETVLSIQGNNFEETMTYLLLFLKENKKYFTKLNHLKEPDDFFHVFYESSYNNTKKKIEENLNYTLSQDEEYYLTFFISGCAYICEQWIRKGMKEPPEYIARLLKESIPSALKNFIL